MPIKKQPAKKYPALSGEYEIGDPKSAIVMVPLRSHLEDMPVKAVTAIMGEVSCQL